MRINNKPGSKKLNTFTGTGKIEQLNNSKGFTDLLTTYYTSEKEAELDELLTNLDSIGKRLLESFSIYELKNYIGTLKGFLQKTRGRVYGLKEETVYTRNGKIKVMHLIQEIDKQLDELAKLVLARQKDQMKILAKIDQIRGLLVDLYS